MTDAALSDETYGYFWFRHKKDASTFIACRDDEEGEWFMCGIGVAISESTLKRNATLLGPVARFVASGESIDQ
jgi:hypothetical protein